MLSRLVQFSSRQICLALGIFCLVSVGLAVVLGHVFDLEVCSMCWFQRISFGVAGCAFLLAGAWPRSGVVIRRLSELALLIGFASAARQSWLLLHPAEASGSCGAGLMYYWQIGNYEAILQAGLLGGVECAENQPLILGLYLPQWSLLAFSAVIALYLVWWLGQRRARRAG